MLYWKQWNKSKPTVTSKPLSLFSCRVCLLSYSFVFLWHFVSVVVNVCNTCIHIVHKSCISSAAVCPTQIPIGSSIQSTAEAMLQKEMKFNIIDRRLIKSVDKVKELTKTILRHLIWKGSRLMIIVMIVRNAYLVKQSSGNVSRKCCGQSIQNWEVNAYLSKSLDKQNQDMILTSWLNNGEKESDSCIPNGTDIEQGRDLRNLSETTIK